MEKIKVAVSGINAVDNPGPGIGVIRSLREDNGVDLYVCGLAYDAMEPGIYMDWLVDKVFMMPYPSSSEKDYLARLLYIKEKVGLDFIIPTLDAELPLYTKIKEKLEKLGIKTFLPTKQQLELRNKTRLEDVAKRIGIEFPRSASVYSHEDMIKAIEEIGFPLMVKGVFYKAYKAHTYQEAIQYFHNIVAEWGYPVLVQKVVNGEEMNVVGLGDGKGGNLGLMAIKKLWITSLGKIWTGITVKNNSLLESADRFIREFKWKGGFELECIVSQDNKIWLIEINPRFPAWIYFSTGVGLNLPARMLRAAFGMEIDKNNEYEAGRMYVCYTYEVVTDLKAFQNITTKGEY